MDNKFKEALEAYIRDDKIGFNSFNDLVRLGEWAKAFIEESKDLCQPHTHNLHVTYNSVCPNCGGTQLADADNRFVESKDDGPSKEHNSASVASHTSTFCNSIEQLLELLALHGGKIVSTASLQSEWIEQARASGRMYVDENSLGFVWEPSITEFPTTVEQVEFLEKWYPLPVELPEKLKDPSFLLNSDKNDAVSDTTKDASSNADGSIKTSNEAGNKSVEQCNVCGGGKVLIRGRFPKDPKRLVCPSCAVEKLEDIEQQSNNQTAREKGN